VRGFTQREGTPGRLGLILEVDMTAAIVAEPAGRDSLLHNYVFDVNGRFLEVQADNDILAFAIVFEQFPREQAVLVAKTDA
jgi:hypothetical protein